MTVEELVKRFRITKAENGKIRFWGKPEAAKYRDEIRSKKAEIIAYLDAQAEAKRKAYEERKAKIAAIEGLKEIRDAKYDLEAWHRGHTQSSGREAKGASSSASS